LKANALILAFGRSSLLIPCQIPKNVHHLLSPGLFRVFQVKITVAIGREVVEVVQTGWSTGSLSWLSAVREGHDA
jgi:hypothetical protein